MCDPPAIDRWKLISSPATDAAIERVGDRDTVDVGGFVAVGISEYLLDHITQNANQIVFCGTLTTGGLEISAGDGELSIEHEGDQPKFLDAVE